MPELSKPNHAHVSVFMFLRINGQSIRPFTTEANNPGMGLQLMKDLTYFNSAASQDILKANAALIAHMLIVFINTYYTQQRETGYEDMTVPELVAELLTIMIKPDKTVHDLATKADAMFKYKNEASAAVPVSAVAAEVKIPAATSKKLKKLGIK